MQKIGIITYQYPHLKAEQMILALLEEKDLQLKIYAAPYKQRTERKVRLMHRPPHQYAATPEEMASKFSLSYKACDSYLDIDDACDVYLIAGAGIIPAQSITGRRIVNAHPGIIPYSRGLDSFKWAIYNMIPVGNTLHYISEEVDMGETIAIRETPVFMSDTLEVLARRHFESEVYLISNALSYIRKGSPVISPYMQDYMHKNPQINEPTRRMSLEMEDELYIKFEQYKKLFA